MKKKKCGIEYSELCNKYKCVEKTKQNKRKSLWKELWRRCWRRRRHIQCGCCFTHSLRHTLYRTINSFCYMLLIKGHTGFNVEQLSAGVPLFTITLLLSADQLIYNMSSIDWLICSCARETIQNRFSMLHGVTPCSLSSRLSLSLSL